MPQRRIVAAAIVALAAAATAQRPATPSAAQRPPAAVALVEDSAGAPIAEGEAIWAFRDPRVPQRLQRQDATIGPRSQARWTTAGPLVGTATVLVRAHGEGTVASIPLGDAKRVVLEPMGWVQVAADSDFQSVRWALSRGGLELPALVGTRVALPPGAYVGVVVGDRSLSTCAFEIQAGHATTITWETAEPWSPIAGWNTAPRGRCEVFVDAAGPIAVCRDPQVLLECWRENPLWSEVVPWPPTTDPKTPTHRRTFEFAGEGARGGILAVASTRDGRGTIASRRANPVALPDDLAVDIRVWSDGLWNWPVALPATGDGPPIPLPEGRELQVVVVGDQGPPAGGATVTWWPIAADSDIQTAARRAQQRPPAGITTTDNRGTARFAKTGSVRGILLVDHPEALPQWLEVSAGDARLMCTLQSGGSIKGVVLGADGLPARGVRVWARATGGTSGQLPRGADTNADGHFEIRGLSEGPSYVVSAAVVGDAETFSARAVRVPAGGDELHLRLRSEDPALPGAGHPAGPTGGTPRIKR